MNEGESDAYLAGIAAVAREVQKALTEEYERHPGALDSRDIAARSALQSVMIYLKVRGVAVSLPGEEVLLLKHLAGIKEAEGSRFRRRLVT